jgi:hypothetical protein
VFEFVIPEDPKNKINHLVFEFSPINFDDLTKEYTIKIERENKISPFTEES